MAEKTFAQVDSGDPFKLARAMLGRPVGTRGVVTMRCRDGLSGAMLVRVRFEGEQAEHFVKFPTSDLDFLEGDELAAHLFARL